MQQRWPVLAVRHREATPFRTGLAVPLRAGRIRFRVTASMSSVLCVRTA